MCPCALRLAVVKRIVQGIWLGWYNLHLFGFGGGRGGAGVGAGFECGGEVFGVGGGGEVGGGYFGVLPTTSIVHCLQVRCSPRVLKLGCVSTIRGASPSEFYVVPNGFIDIRLRCRRWRGGEQPDDFHCRLHGLERDDTLFVVPRQRLQDRQDIKHPRNLMVACFSRRVQEEDSRCGLIINNIAICIVDHGVLLTRMIDPISVYLAWREFVAVSATAHIQPLFEHIPLGLFQFHVILLRIGSDGCLELLRLELNGVGGFGGGGGRVVLPLAQLLEEPCDVKVLPVVHVVIWPLEDRHEDIPKDPLVPLTWSAHFPRGKDGEYIANLHATHVVHDGGSVTHKRHVSSMKVEVHDTSINV